MPDSAHDNGKINDHTRSIGDDPPSTERVPMAGASRWIVVCATPRTGSTLLCEDLRNNDLGRAEEHFLPYVYELEDETVPANMIDEVTRASCGGSGIASVKIMANYAEMIEALLRAWHPELANDRFLGSLAGVFENATWVYLTRRSRIRQAISHRLSEKRGVLHLVACEDVSSRPGNAIVAGSGTLLSDFTLTAQEVGERCLDILREDELWERFFAENAIYPVRVEYEDIIDDVEYIRSIGARVGRTFRQLNVRRVLLPLSNDANEVAYNAFMNRSEGSDAATPGTEAEPTSPSRASGTREAAPSGATVSMADGLRFVRTIGIPQVYCLVNGRRRLVPYAEWWLDEGWAELPIFEILRHRELLQFPLGPPCPVAALLKGKSMEQIVHDSQLMRAYLGTLASGIGIECGAGRNPFAIPLHAQIKYVDAFPYGIDVSRSFPGVANFSDFVQVDMVERIESMAAIPDSSLDFVFASHVIEHTPNPIAALVAANRLLRRGGKFILIVPDKDRTFDRPREVTPIAHMVLDYDDYQRERDLAHYEEWYARVTPAAGGAAQIDWQLGADLRYHCFTPASFMELIAASTRYAQWSRTEFFLPCTERNPASIEFYAVLHK